MPSPASAATFPPVDGTILKLQFLYFIDILYGYSAPARPAKVCEGWRVVTTAGMGEHLHALLFVAILRRMSPILQRSRLCSAYAADSRYQRWRPLYEGRAQQRWVPDNSNHLNGAGGRHPHDDHHRRWCQHGGR